MSHARSFRMMQLAPNALQRSVLQMDPGGAGCSQSSTSNPFVSCHLEHIRLHRKARCLQMPGSVLRRTSRGTFCESPHGYAPKALSRESAPT